MNDSYWLHISIEEDFETYFKSTECKDHLNVNSARRKATSKSDIKIRQVLLTRRVFLSKIMNLTIVIFVHVYVMTLFLSFRRENSLILINPVTISCFKTGEIQVFYQYLFDKYRTYWLLVRKWVLRLFFSWIEVSIKKRTSCCSSCGLAMKNDMQNFWQIEKFLIKVFQTVAYNIYHSYSISLHLIKLWLIDF